jgi:hypothetical protein
MARHYFAFRAGYADERPFKFFVNEAQRLKQRAVRGAGYASKYRIAFHNFLLLCGSRE